MDKAHDGKLTYMSDVCDRIFQRLELLKGQDPEGDKGKYIAARLAEYVDTSESTVSQWKSGSTQFPRPHNLCLAAQYLKTTEWWLTFGNDRRRKDPRCDSKGNILEPSKSGPTGGFPPPYPYPPEVLELIEAADPPSTGRQAPPEVSRVRLRPRLRSLGRDRAKGFSPCLNYLSSKIIDLANF